MDSNLIKISELETILSNIDNTYKGVLQFFDNFQISKVLVPFDNLKTKGIEVSSLISLLCLFRMKGLTVWAMQKFGREKLFDVDENTFYRLMNHPGMNWRKLLMSFTRQFVSIAESKGDIHKNEKCFVVDDSDLEKTGSTFEFIGRIFNHVNHNYILGFKALVLGYWDGTSLVAADFSLHREKGSKGNYGISRKERDAQFKKKREQTACSKQRIKELDQKKTDVAISMVRRAVRNHLKASYVLMDSWFVNDKVIKSIRKIAKGVLHVLGMCKMNNTKYKIEGQEWNAHQIIMRKERKMKKYSRKHHSHYIPVVVDYKGTMVKLFFIRYHRAKNWDVILTTNLQLTFTQALELYQIRWTIEVLFRECKQYLRLGACQNTDFDGQIADTTLVFITHTILTLQRRFEAYETTGELFREAQQQLLELTLWQRILKIFMKMLRQLLDIFSIDVDDTLKRILQNDQISSQLLAMMEILKEEKDNDEKMTKMVA